MRREAKAPAVTSRTEEGQSHAGRAIVHSDGRTLIAASRPVSSPARAIRRNDHALFRTNCQFSTGFNHVSSVFDMNKLHTKRNLFLRQLSTTGSTASSILYIQVSRDTAFDDHHVDRRSGVQGNKDVPPSLHEVGRCCCFGPGSNHICVFTHPAPEAVSTGRSAAPQLYPPP
jgi:hypothetical protein